MTRLFRLAPLALAAAAVASVDACRRPQVEAPGPRSSSSVDTSFRQGSMRDSIARAERIRQQAIDDSIRAARRVGGGDRAAERPHLVLE